MMSSPQNPQDSSSTLPSMQQHPNPNPHRRSKQPGTAAAWANSSSLTFPYKLHDMLAYAGYENFTDIVSWHPLGESFKIHIKEKFVSRILPQFFSATKYHSFYLQLHMWGFKGTLEPFQGKKTYAFSHPHFIRDNPQLSKLILRKKETKSAKNVFPYRLHELLAATANEQVSSIMSWLPDGRSFRIHDKSQFESLILPRLLNAKTYDYFTTKMNAWGFKTCHDEDGNTYFHEYFVRDNPEQCSYLSHRQDTKKSATTTSQPATNATTKRRNEATKESATTTSQPATNTTTKRRNDEDVVFPLKLHQLLESAETEDFDSIISWLPDGKSFKIHKKEEFVSTVLPRFFPKQHHYKSFYSHLYAWGFKGRRSEKKGSSSYSHECFARGKPELCDLMTKKQQRATTPTGTTATSSDNNQNCCSDQTFPNTLRHMLQVAEKERFASIISWLPDGKAFQIHDKEEFVSSILPRFFPSLRQYISFYMRLNFLGFISCPPRRKFTYSHEHFVRDDLELWNEYVMKREQKARGSENDRRESTDQFPSLLHKMLESAEADDFASIVSWLPDGRSFKVHNKNEFVSSVMPSFFGTTANFLSFYNQLRSHGFQCQGKHTYLHQHFLRDKPDACNLITTARKRKRERKSRTRTSITNNNIETMHTDNAGQPTLMGSSTASAKKSAATGDIRIDNHNAETRSRGTELRPLDDHHATTSNTFCAVTRPNSTEITKQEVIDISSDDDEDHKTNPDDYPSNDCYMSDEQFVNENREEGNSMNLSRMSGGFPSSCHESPSVACSHQQQDTSIDGTTADATITATAMGDEKKNEKPDDDQLAINAFMRGYQASYFMGQK